MTAATVTASSLNLRAQPNGSVLGSLKQGASVRILQDAGDWVEVIAGGTRGFVMEKYLKLESLPTAAAPPPTAAAIPPDASEGELRIEGRRCLGPGGLQFGTTHQLGLFNTGKLQIAGFMKQGGALLDNAKPSLVRVMSVVAENEGALEAVNTWDNCFLSFGSLQWTAGPGTDPGELGGLLARLKARYPDTFQKYFGRHGLDANKPNERPVIDYSHLRLDGTVLDTPQKKATLRKPIWAYRFWRAGHDTTVQLCEVEHTLARLGTFYRQPRSALGNRSIADLVTSEYGVALVFDQHTNRPGHVATTVPEAYRRCTLEGTLPADPAQWTTDHEATLLRRYLELRHATSMTDSRGRAEKLQRAVTAGRLSEARGSFAA